MLTNKINPDALLRRSQVAEVLTSAGYPIATASLASMVSRGGGPPFRTFGRTVLYRWADVIAWTEARMSPPHRASSEVAAHGAGAGSHKGKQKDKGPEKPEGSAQTWICGEARDD